MWRNFLSPPNTVRVAISGREKTTALVRPILFDVRTTPNGYGEVRRRRRRRRRRRNIEADEDWQRTEGSLR